AFHVGDLRPVGAPARLAAVRGDAGAAGAVAVHVIDVAHLGVTRALIGDEADLGTIGRPLGVELIHVRCARQVNGGGANGVAQVEFPVAVAVGFIDQLVGIGLEFGEQVSGVCVRLRVRTSFSQELQRY